MSIELEALVTSMKDAASDVLEKDVTTIRGFAERQLKAIGQQTILVQTGIAAGQITEETRDFFLDGIEDMVMNFARTLRGLVLVTIEKVWNAIVGVLWKAINSATGLALPIP